MSYAVEGKQYVAIAAGSDLFTFRLTMKYKLILLFLLAAVASWAQAPCVVESSRAEFAIAHVAGKPKLTLNERSAVWKHAASQKMWKDCSKQIEYPETATTIKAFWTDTDLYFFFRCPYKELNLFLPANHAGPRVGLWDRDVVEMFLGDDWQNIRHYREFEIAPTGDWIDLAIDLDKKEDNDHSWRSGWETLARTDKAHKIWYSAARIPIKVDQHAARQRGNEMAHESLSD